MADAKRQLNVRISADLYNKIENHNGSKQEIISDALMLYFDSNIKQDLAKDLDHEREKNQLLQNTINLMESNNKNLQQQLGFLQLEYQKITERLMLPSSRSWWQFWK